MTCSDMQLKAKPKLWVKCLCCVDVNTPDFENMVSCKCWNLFYAQSERKTPQMFSLFVPQFYHETIIPILSL